MGNREPSPRRQRVLDRRHRRINEMRTAERSLAQSWAMFLFGIFRCSVWLTILILIAVGNPTATRIAETLLFISLVSIYANLATDYDQVTSSWAAIIAARTHHLTIQIAQEEEDERARQEAEERRRYEP